ncbi:protein kinase [Elysia marginata]|uniref:Protein kinase n=1 Tax=Elysia marginata TaxID=1093978 RepID=A0AAV4I1C6_9GAST|nr:protein kinase [Elysia marginata]
MSHHHLVPCVRAACCHDYAVILMPFYANGDLWSLQGRQEPSRVIRYMSHVARAVAHLHRNIIVHNDIKLENVLLDGSDRAHLADMGHALNFKEDGKSVISCLVGGTKDYWSPEKLGADPYTEIDPFKIGIGTFAGA